MVLLRVSHISHNLCQATYVGFKLLVKCIVSDCLQGYRDPLNVRMHELPISVEDAKVLFAEIREIRDFNRFVHRLFTIVIEHAFMLSVVCKVMHSSEQTS